MSVLPVYVFAPLRICVPVPTLVRLLPLPLSTPVYAGGLALPPPIVTASAPPLAFKSDKLREPQSRPATLRKAS